MKRSGPPQRSTPLRRSASLATVTPLESRRRLSPVSAKRRAKQRERRRAVDAKWPDRPRCVVPGCSRLADDVHEPVTRARGGSITDPANLVAVCRWCHGWLHDHPAEAAELGLLKPSGGAA